MTSSNKTQQIEIRLGVLEKMLDNLLHKFDHVERGLMRLSIQNEHIPEPVQEVDDWNMPVEVPEKKEEKKPDLDSELSTILGN